MTHPKPPKEPSAIPYDRLMYNLRVHLVRHVLEMTAQNGLVGDHFFQLTIKTAAQGVILPAYLKERYPNEIMLVLQHRFENLKVTDAGFRATLYFNGKPECIFIPWQAILIFQDPSVPFGLQVLSPEKAFSEEDLDFGVPTMLEPQKTIEPLVQKQKKDSEKPSKTGAQTKGEIIALASHRTQKQHQDPTE